MRLCTVTGCDRKHYGKGFCRAHYLRNRKSGNPHGSGQALRGQGQAFLEEAAQAQVDDCINWPFALTDQGYPSIWKDGAATGGHAEVCRMAHGERPEGKGHAAHSCGNRACVNPRHLRWATHSENMQDKKLHGTENHLRGDDHPNVKVPQASIPKIRKSALPSRRLAEKHGVSISLIQKIRSNKARKA